MEIPKKKITIKVKPHTISVGPKKPNGGNTGVESPVAPVNYRKSFLGRCLDVVKEDLHLKSVETRAILKDPNEDWEKYVAFLKMAEGDLKK